MTEEKLSELPEGWTHTSIEAISNSVQYGHTAKACDSKVGPKFLRITDIQDSKVIWENVPYCEISEIDETKYLLHTGDIVFARTGATVGKSYLIRDNVPSKSIFASYLIRIKLSTSINPKFVYNFFQSKLYWDQIVNSSAGIGQPNVNGKKLGKIVLPLAPLPEQRRIVARIEELFSRLDAGIEALQRARVQLRRYRQAVLKAAVEGRLTEEWRKEHPEVEPAEKLLERILKERQKIWEEKHLLDGKDHRRFNYKQPVQPFSFDLGPLPKGWIWTSYDVLTSFITSGSRAWKRFLGKGHAVFILLQNLRERQLILDDPTFIDAPEGAEADRTRILNGDILISIVGNTGITCLVREIGEAYVSQSVALTRPIKLINGEYLEFYLSSERGQNFFKEKDYGMGRGHLLLSHIRETPIALPPISEQEEIIQEIQLCFSATYDAEKAIDQSLIRADRLRQSILKRAFEGRLVPQDPGDEPACVLLERIRAERSISQFNHKRHSRLRDKSVQEQTTLPPGGTCPP